MKISIITVCYNSATTIEDTIKSVISQDYRDLEYIIIDGGSIDGTLEIINKYNNKINKIVSEPDGGIYDAMNKGIKLAVGDIVGILNSDDFYFGNNILSDVSKKFEIDSAEAVYGDIVYVDRKDIKKQVRIWHAGEYRREKLESGWIMPHPAFFAKKDLYQKYGLFNLNFKIAADYELMLRFLQKGIKMNYLKNFLVCMREGGYSSASFNHRLSGWSELKNAWKVNNLKVPAFFVLKRVLNKINQYLIK